MGFDLAPARRCASAGVLCSPIGARGRKPFDTSVGVVPWRQSEKEELRFRQKLEVTRRGGKSVNI